MSSQPIIGYDSARPETIPADAAAVFPYADGQFAWSHKRFPRARYRYITVAGNPHADIADYEPGAIWGSEALLAWAHTRLETYPASDLTVYVDRVNFPFVRAVMHEAGLTWHLFLSVGPDPILNTFDGMPVRACQRFGHGFDTDYVFEPEWLNLP